MDSNKPSFIVRPFLPADRTQLRHICYVTSFLERPHDFIDDEEVVADALTQYFTDYEPESCFVAVSENKVIGYLTGTRNVISMDRLSRKKVYPSLMFKCLRSPFLWRKNCWKFLAGCLRSFLKGDLARPDFSKQYPAILHINIEKGFRQSGVGRQLIETYLKYLKTCHVPGVHCATLSKNAKEFFEKLGFKVLFQGSQFYGQAGHYYILGKML